MDRVKRRKSVSGYPSRTGGLSSLDSRRASRCLSLFSTLSVGIEQAGLDLTPIKESLYQLIESQDQLQDIIVALWENGAVVTKAAQQLYLHRNSLQYKIDKWEELTGLQLKKSDRSGSLLPFSLARCHLNGINREFCATCTKLFSFCETCHRFVKRFHLQ